MTAQEYLKSHGINKKTQEQFNLTHDSDYLHIPVKDEDGNDLFVKSRNLNFTKEGGEPKYKNSAGSKAALFNLHAVKDSPNIVLCEGEIDCMRLIQEGIPSLTSTGGANTFLPEWEKYFEGKNVWLLLDNDEAGTKGTHKVLEHIPHARVVTLPEGVKDVCDFLQEYKKSDLVQLMRLALTKVEWEATNIPEEFQLITDTELLEMEFPEQDWLIKNVLYSEGFCFLYGAEGTGKSYIAMSIAKAVATGSNWLDHFEVPSPEHVLILDKENPLSMLKRRSEGLGSTTSNIHYLKYPEKFSLSDGKGNVSTFAQSLSTLAQKNNIRLIVIDSFVDLMVGNESSSADTQVFFNALRELFPRTAFLVLHHENKPSQGIFRSDSQRLRGSSNINAQTFTMFRLEQVAKSKTELTLKQTKARDSVKLDKFMVRMNVKNNPDNSTYIAGFDYLGEIAEAVDDSKLAEIKESIEEMVSLRKFVSKQDIVDLAGGKGISDKTATRAIKEMLEAGTLNETKKGREKWYSMGMFVQTEDGEIEDITEVFNGEL